MFEHDTTVRVRSGAIDQMGYLYYGAYAQFNNVGRIKVLPSLGISYRQMEEEHGILMPVMKVLVRYWQPAQ